MEEPVVPQPEDQELLLRSLADMEEPPEEEEPQLHFSPVDFRITLPGDKLEQFERRIAAELMAFNDATDPRMQNGREWRRAWEQIPSGTANRWDGSSEIPSHLTRVYCNSHQTRLNTQIINASPPFAAVARRQDAIEAAPKVEEALMCFLEEAEWAQTADDVHHELAVMGNCYVKTAWCRKFERMPKLVVKTDDEQNQALALAGAPLHEAMWQSIREVQIEHEKVPVYDGVEIKVIPFEDGVILPATARKPEDCYGIGEFYVIWGRDLKQGVKDGFFYEDAVKELLKRASDPIPDHRQERLDDIGIGPDTYNASYEDADYRCYNLAEIDWRGDFDGDGEHEWVIVYFHEESGKIIGLRWKEAEHPGPRYDLFRYIVRPGELFGMGIAELVAPIQDADTAVINQIIDAQDLSIDLSRMFIYDGMTGLDPEEFRTKMGLCLKVDDMTRLKEFPRLAFPQEAYSLRQSFKDMGDLLTSSSNPGLGKTTDANKTLGEVQIVMGSSNLTFEDYAGRVARVWAKVADKVRWLVAQYGMRDETGFAVYRKTAAPDQVEFLSVDPDLLRKALDFVPAGLEQLSDMQTRVQQATLMSSKYMMHPLVAINPQAGIWNWEALDILDEAYTRNLKFQQSKKFLAALRKQAAAMMAMQQMEALMEQGQPPGAPPGPEGAPPEAGGEALEGPPSTPGPEGVGRVSPEEATALAGGPEAPLPGG